MKKNRIRKYSPAWYVRETAEWTVVAAAIFAPIAGIYACVLLLASLPV